MIITDYKKWTLHIIKKTNTRISELAAKISVTITVINAVTHAFINNSLLPPHIQYNIEQKTSGHRFGK